MIKRLNSVSPKEKFGKKKIKKYLKFLSYQTNTNQNES